MLAPHRMKLRILAGLIAALMATLGQFTPVSAHPGAIAVSGTQLVENVAPCAPGSFKMIGSLTGCWTIDTFVEQVASPGIYVASGTEHFVGCVGSLCGTLYSTFVFVGKFDASGNEVWGGCHHPIVGGTGGFAAATGDLNFRDLPNGTPLPPAEYKGRIVLRP